jgi:hypothetical protein
MEPFSNLVRGDGFVHKAKVLLLNICPFTTMGMFNHWMTDANHHSIAAEPALSSRPGAISFWKMLLGFSVKVTRKRQHRLM